MSIEYSNSVQDIGRPEGQCNMNEDWKYVAKLGRGLAGVQSRRTPGWPGLAFAGCPAKYSSKYFEPNILPNMFQKYFCLLQIAIEISSGQASAGWPANLASASSNFFFNIIFKYICHPQIA